MKHAAFNDMVAARFLIRQADQLERIEGLVPVLGKIGVDWWREEVLPLIERAKGLSESRLLVETAVVLRSFWPRATGALERGLMNAIEWAYESGYQSFVDVLPAPYWHRLAAARGMPIREGIDYTKAGSAAAAEGLFQPMPHSTVMRILYAPPRNAEDGLDWKERIEKYSKLTENPGTIADHLYHGLRAGKNPKDIAKTLLPHVQQNWAAAERIARGEALRVSHEALREQWKQFADVISGFKILATLDEVTRPHHRSRSGDLYLHSDEKGRLPEGAKGTPEERPMVPDEPNCRCYESPVMKELPGVFSDVVRKGREVATIDGYQEDPVVMSRWFDQQDEGRKKRIVGARRYALVQDRMKAAGLPQDVTWADVADPKTGKLVLVKTMQVEPIETAVARRSANEIAFERRAALLAQDRQELFPGLKLVAKAPPLPPPPDPPPPRPPDDRNPAGLSPAELRAADEWQTSKFDLTRRYYSRDEYENWQAATSKSELGSKVIRPLDRGLAKLPKFQGPRGGAKIAYRGLHQVEEGELARLLEVGAEIDFDNYQAASVSRQIAEKFAAMGSPESNSVLLEMKSANGRRLAGMSLGGAADSQETVLFERGRRWRVAKIDVSTLPDGRRHHRVVLQEVSPAKDSPLFTGRVAPRKRLWSRSSPLPKGARKSTRRP